MQSVGEETWSNFRDSINSDLTRQTYEYCLNRFLLYCDSDLESLLKLEPQKITNLIIKYISDLRLSFQFKNQILCAIKHACEMNDVLLNWRKIKNSLRKEHLIINKPYKMKNTDTKRKIKVKIHRTSDYDDKYTGIRDFPHEKAMLRYGLSKVDKVIIQKYTKDDEFVVAARKTRGILFDYDMEMCD